MVLMQKPSVIESPSGGTTEKVPRWDLMGIEGCGGGKVVSWLPLMFSGYKSIYRQRNQVRGATRSPRGWRACPLPRDPLEALLTSFVCLYIYSYTTKTSGGATKTLPPPQPSVPVRSHLGTFSSDLPEGDSIMEGFYINTIASPMMCEQFTTDLRVHSYQLDILFSLFGSQYKVLLDLLGDLFDVTLFAVCLPRSNELRIYELDYL